MKKTWSGSDVFGMGAFLRQQVRGRIAAPLVSDPHSLPPSMAILSKNQRQVMC